MKSSIFLAFILAVGTQASWFGSDTPQYQQWSNEELKAWLAEHHITTPSTDTYSRDDLVDLVKSNWNSASSWTYDQYNAAQQAFSNLRESTFETWDESQLRQFLMDQGVVAPKGPREELLQLVRSRYTMYTNAASSFASQASDTASSAVYGDAKYQASQSMSSIIAQATDSVARALDDSKDYVYSTWDDNQLRSYLIEKGVLKTKSEKKREELLTLMKDSYAKVADPVWQAWSDSYMYYWLASHHLVDDRSNIQKNRDALVDQMSRYYYDSNSYVWNTWTDSDMRAWLIEHNVIKSDAQLKREKMMKLVNDNYSNAHDTFWNAWSDSQMRAWLIDNGYMRSDAQVKRDELVKAINEKYTDLSSRTVSYLTWPDARLRAFLREHGLTDNQLPSTRPGLLQETRLRYTQATSKSEALFNSIRDIVNNGMYAGEDQLHKVWDLLSGGTEQKWNEGKDKAQEGRKWAEDKYAEGQDKSHQATGKVQNEL
ncbi:hypothetical protein BDZ89DRAFT_1056368 [Hymenopellis radicata]|nr:hypothetical protein BDZ89DRAFT_1056368 [Hymenopellis radicata]